MFILRLIGSWFLIAAMIALVYDGTKSMGNPNMWIITSFSDIWGKLHPSSFAAAQVGVEKWVHPFLWDPILINVMALPGWLLLGAIGGLLFYLGRKRTRMNIYTN